MTARTSVLTFRKSATDAEPILILDGQDVARDALVSLPAGEIARFAYGAAVAGVDAVRSSGRSRKTVQRDDRGQITQIVDEPIL